MSILLEKLPDVNWLLIAFTVILSGGVAFLGDILGMKIAKKRISLFGLRPRYTGSIITAVIGVLIAIGIMATLAMTSETVRVALFTIKYVQRQVVELTSNLQESRDESDLIGLRYVESQARLESKEAKLVEIENRLSTLTPELETTKKEITQLKAEKEELESTSELLRKETADLRKGLAAVREGRVIVFADELLAQETVPEGASKEKIEESLSNVRDRAQLTISQRSSLPIKNVVIERDNLQELQVMERCSIIDSRKVIQARAGSNIVAGEPVPIKYRVYESVRVYRKGEPLVSREIDENLDGAAVEADLHSLLLDVNRLAVTNGILRDPFSRTVGQIDATDFYEAVDRLQNSEVKKIVTVVAAEDIYSEGPVRVYLSIGKPEE